MAKYVVPNFSPHHKKTKQQVFHNQDTIVQIPEPGAESEAPLEHPEQDGPDQKGRRRSFTLSTCPHPQAGAVQITEGSLGNREAKVHIQLPQHCGMLPRRSTWVSAQGDHWRYI